MRRSVFLGVSILLSAFGAKAQTPNTINTIAGGGTNSGAATNAYISGPSGVVVDNLGNTYVSATGVSIVYKVTSGGVISAFAGNGIAGFSGDEGPAVNAELNNPLGLALDANNNLYIADSANNRIRWVDSSGKIHTYAGSGNQYNGTGFFGGFSGDNGPATSALMNFPVGIAFDKHGNLFIADSVNDRIRMVDTSIQHIITTYAGNGTPGTPGTANGDGGPATSAQLSIDSGKTGVAVDANDNLFIADSGDSVVRRVAGTPDHTIATYAGNIANIFTYSGDNAAANQAGLNFPTGVGVDGANNLFIADNNNARIRKVDTQLTPIITTVAGNGLLCLSFASCGDGGVATTAALNQPFHVFPDSTGKLAITDTGTNRLRVVSGGSISTFAGGGTGGDGGPGTSAVVAAPFTLAVDKQGNVYLDENTGNRIRRWDATAKTISTYVGNGIAAVPGSPNGDGGLATAANVVAPIGIALDSIGNLVFADGNARVVRRVDQATKHIATFAGTGGGCNTNTNPGCGDGGLATAATFKRPFGVAFDSKGNLYISDSRVQRIRVVDAATLHINNYAGTGAACVWTAAAPCGDGGPATSASFNVPQGLSFDSQDNLYIADVLNNIIRKIDGTTHIITTYAFNGQPTFGGDGGSALSASMQVPEQVAVDSEGALFVGGGFDNVVRRIDMNDQSVITVAGDVHNLDGGFRATDDGGPSNQALLTNFGVAVDGNQNMFIADAGNGRIRMVHLAPVAVVTSLLQPFGPVLPGDMSNPGIVTITNSGLDDLTVTSASVPAGFTLTNSCLNPATQMPIPISPVAGSCFLDVAFAPPVGTPNGTPFAGNLTFNTNDPAHPSFSFALNGTAVTTPETLTITLAGTGAGTVSGSPEGLVNGSPAVVVCTNATPPPCPFNFALGQQVTLFAIGNAGSAFTGWTVNGSATTCPATTFTCTVTMSAVENVTASFGPASVSVAGMGNGSGHITSSPAGIDCTVTNGVASGPTCTFSNFPAGTQNVTLTATAAAGGSSFSGWLGLCGLIGSNGLNTVGTGPCTLPFSIAGVTALNGALATAVFSAPAQRLMQGQVFVGTVDGMIFVYNPDGTLARVLNSGNLGGTITEMNFDIGGNLYAANPLATNTGPNPGTVEFFMNTGAGPSFDFGLFDSQPSGVLLAPSGNIFVSQSAGQNTLLEFTNVFNGSQPVNTFFPAFENGGVGFMELRDDGTSVLYTSNSPSVKNFDILNNHQNPDFATNLPGGPAYALRELGDKTVLVANSTEIVRLNSTGSVVQTYKPGGGGLFFALNLDPDGSSFWSGDALSGKVYRLKISDGSIIGTPINTGLGFNAATLNFATIFGIAVLGQPASGGADLAVAVTAPTIDDVNAQITYTATITNNGPLAAAGVTVTDTFPAGVTVNSAVSSQGPCTVAQTVTCTVGAMANLAVVTVTIKATATVAMTLMNTVTANATTPDPIPGNNSFTTSTTVLGATLAAITMAAPSDVELGASLSYQIQVSNPGGTTLSGITVTDTLPASLNASSLSPGCTGTNAITCAIGTLTAGQIVNLSITIVPTVTGVLANTANVTGGNSATVNTTVITGGVPLVLEVDSVNFADFITTSPSSGMCTTAQGICTAYFPPGTVVTVTANGPGFLGWSVNNASSPSCPPASNTCSVTLSSPQQVLAAYSAIGIAPSQLTGVVGIPFGVDFSNHLIGGVPPDTITLTGTVPTGLTFTTPFLTGTPTATGVTPLTVNITDSLGEKGSTPVTLTIINAPTGQEALMTGNYGIVFHGVNDSDGSLFVAAGSLHFTGKGLIDTGTIDTNSNAAGKGPQTISVTGTYTIGADHRCLIKLQGAGLNQAVMACSVGDVYKGVAHTAFLINFDDNTGTGNRGDGIAKLQDPKAFNAASFAGPYIFAGTGQDSTFARFIEEGLFTVTSTVTATGNFGSGSADVNDNGVLATVPSITGTYSEPGLAVPIDPGTGRTQWSLNNATTSAASFIIDANNVVFITKDLAATSGLVMAGTAERQLNTAPFDATFLSGPDVIAGQGPSNAPQNSHVFIGVGTFTAATGLNPTTGTLSFTGDKNDGGNVTLEVLENDTYTMAANGRFVVTPASGNPVFGYLSRPNHGYVMGTGSRTDFGTIDLQTGGPFTVPALPTDYSFGGREPSSNKRGEDVSGVTTLSNNTVSATFDQSHQGGRLDYDFSASFGISLAPTGRLILTSNRTNVNTSNDETGQVITPSHIVFTEFDPSTNHPTLHEEQSFLMPAGLPLPNPASVTFPTPIASGSNAMMTLTFTNSSDGLLSFTGVTNATDFSVSSGTCVTGLPVVVLAHSTCTAVITLAPQPGTPAGPISENLTLQTDGGNVTITANGTVAGQTDTLTVTITGNGLVTSTSVPTIANEINCANPTPPSVCIATFNIGTSVSLTAAPGAGQMFNGWTAGPCISSLTNPCAFVISATTPNPTASFITIVPTLTSITVAPRAAFIPAGTTQPFQATGHFSDGSSGPVSVTWASGNTGTATINSSTGLATGVAAGGPVTITATSTVMASISGTAPLTVFPPIGFVLTGSMTTPRSDPTATLLNTGQVLVAGGVTLSGNTTTSIQSSELYNPTTGTFTATGSLNAARAGHTATLLPDGKVLIVGGASIAGAEIYDPRTGAFTLTGNLINPRGGHTATLLNNGMVLIAGGENSSGTFIATAELFNPATGNFTSTASLNTPRVIHTATLLNNGTVLIAAGRIDSPGIIATNSAEIYDPIAGTFTVTGSLIAARFFASATALNNGMVLVVGGDDSQTPNQSNIATAELYNPATGTFSATGALTTPPDSHTATLLNNGNVLIVGGQAIANTSTGLAFRPLPSAELYDPSSGTFTATGSMNAARETQIAILLNNGKVLVAGGDDGVNALASAELYTPSTMTPPGLTAITVTPTNPTIPVGPFQRFVATGTFSSGPQQTLASVTWSSSNTGVASITNDAGSKGYADDSPGTTTITATAGSVNGSTLLTVVGPATHFAVSAQSVVSAGTAFNFTVTAQDAANNTVTTFADTVNFSSTDAAAILPGSDVGLTNGVGNFQATLNTVGPQTITVTDANTAAIKGVSNTITVSAGAPQTANVHLIDNGSGAVGTVTDNSVPQQINCTDATGQLPGPACSTTYPDGATVTFTATPGAGAAFGSWNGSNVTCKAGTAANVCTVTVTGFTSLDANFTNGPGGPFTLTVAPPTGATGGGRVTSGITGGSLNCSLTGATTSGTCTSIPLKSGTVSETIAQADANSTFGGYAGSCATQVGNNCFVPMSQNQTVTPVFNIIPITLNIAFAGNGTVTSDVGGINCANPPVAGNVCKTTVNSGTVVNLTETPGTGFSFGSWNPACTSPTCTLTLNAANEPTGSLTVTATFTALQKFTLTVTDAGTGSGTVKSQQGLIPAISCTTGTADGCSGTYNSGTLVTLTATAAAGSTFAGWSGGTPACSGTGTCSVTMTQARNVTATFNVSTGPTLVSIAVFPNPDIVNVGGTNQLFATGTFSDNSHLDLTNTATWSSSDSTIATVSATGLATGVKLGGPVTVQATQSGITGSASLSVVSTFTGPYQLGELFASFANGYVGVFKSDGTFLGTINTGQAQDTGLQFDTKGNLYVTTFGTPTGVVKLDINGNVIGPFGSGYTGNPESIVFNLAGDAFVGEAQTHDPTNPAPVPVLEIDANGNLIATFNVARQDRGSDWVELLGDQKTLLYTSEGTSIKSFDISKNLQNADFATNLPGSSAYALRQLPDGTILVADTTAALRLTSAGAIQTTYTPNPAPQNLFALNLDPDGTSFWTADLTTGVIYRFDIASGRQLTNFTAPSNFVSGVAIFGEKAPGANNITVTENGNGGGTVTSQPVGINCPAVCVAPFADNTSVTLTATPNANSTFGAFSDNCTPANPQTNPPTCVVALGTTDIPVTVTFNTGAPQTTHFLLTAPVSATAGTSFNFTVTAQDASNHTVTTYNGTVHFTSSDAAATLPADSTLTNGVGTFSATLNTAGSQTITATDKVTASITGSATVTVIKLVSIAVTPANPTVVVGQQQQFTATGTFSDNSQKDLTSSVTWSSTNGDVASIVNTPGVAGTGNATALAAGSTTITATDPPSVQVSGSTTLTVTNVPFLLTITPPGGNPGTPFTVSPGGTLAIGLVLTATPGFSGTVTFSCVSDKPQFLTCTPAPSSVTLSGSTPKQVAIVLNTFCKGDAPMYGPGPGGFGGELALLLAAAMLGSITWAYRTRPRWALSFAALMLIALGSAACGGPPSGPSGRTPAGDYTLNITASVQGGASQTVQQPIHVTP